MPKIAMMSYFVKTRTGCDQALQMLVQLRLATLQTLTLDINSRTFALDVKGDTGNVDTGRNIIGEVLKTYWSNQSSLCVHVCVLDVYNVM